MTGKEKNNLCVSSGAFCPTAVRVGASYFTRVCVWEPWGSNFRPEPWGTVSLSASGVSPGCPPPTLVPPHNRKPWRPLSRCEEALTSLAGTGPRTPSSCSHCGPGGLWVRRRTSAPTAARTPRDQAGSVPITCLGPLLLTARPSIRGMGGRLSWRELTQE